MNGPPNALAPDNEAPKRHHLENYKKTDLSHINKHHLPLANENSTYPEAGTYLDGHRVERKHNTNNAPTVNKHKHDKPTVISHPDHNFTRNADGIAIIERNGNDESNTIHGKAISEEPGGRNDSLPKGEEIEKIDHGKVISHTNGERIDIDNRGLEAISANHGL